MKCNYILINHALQCWLIFYGLRYVICDVTGVVAFEQPARLIQIPSLLHAQRLPSVSALPGERSTFWIVHESGYCWSRLVINTRTYHQTRIRALQLNLMREFVFSLIETEIFVRTHWHTHTHTWQSIGAAYKSKIRKLDALSLVIATKSSCNAPQNRRLACRPCHFQLSLWSGRAEEYRQSTKQGEGYTMWLSGKVYTYIVYIYANAIHIYIYMHFLLVVEEL